MKTPVFFKDWSYGFLKDGMDFNPDSFVVPGRAEIGSTPRPRRGSFVVAGHLGRSTPRTIQAVAAAPRRSEPPQVPEDKLVNADNMSAAITIHFFEDDDSTTLFAAQFVALDKPKSDTDLYTMVVRVSACARINHRGAAISTGWVALTPRP